jgi:hypothetical protein
MTRAGRRKEVGTMAEERIEDRPDDTAGQLRRVSAEEPQAPEDDVEGARRKRFLGETEEDVEGHGRKR